MLSCGSPAPAPPACPAEMAPVSLQGHQLCIDRYEASWHTAGARESGIVSVPGAVPITGLSWLEARDLCSAAGKQLCTVAEWQAACQAAGSPTRADCATVDAEGRPRLEGMQPTGSLPACSTAQGVHDLLGNAWEWADPESHRMNDTPAAAKLGGAWYTGFDAARCDATNWGQHPPTFEGTIGFRCCRDL